MKNTVSIVLLFICFFIMENVFSQDYESMGNDGLCHGETNITIPITEIDIKNFKLPIYLKYSTSGIKVDDFAGTFGLGWSLNDGGYITRIVRGLPDDYNSGDDHNNWDKNNNGKGYLFQDVAQKVKDFDVSWDNNTIQDNLYSFQDNSKETEPDLFYYNINGKSGRFSFDYNKQIKPFVFCNLKFSCTRGSNGRINEFDIIDNDGTKYIFSSCETLSIHVEGLEPSENLNYAMFPFLFKVNGDYDISYTETWRLTNIILPNSQSISYNYEDESFTISPDRPAYKLSFNTVILGDRPTKYTVTNTLKRITSITTDLQKIEFTKGVEREDITGTFKIDKIQIFSKDISNNLSLAKELTVPTDYFVTPNGSSDYKRLKLASVSETMNSETNISYKFYYKETVKLPPYNSTAQDIWGYYNGQTSNPYLFPKTYVYPDRSDPYRSIPIPGYTGTCYQLLTGGAERTPNAETIDAFILEKIKLPTGGYLKYTFSPNEYIYDNTKYQGGGLRIDKIESYDESDHLKKETEFIYDDIESTSSMTSGKLLSIPHFSFLRYRIVFSASNSENVQTLYDDNKSDFYGQMIRIVNCDWSSTTYESPIIYKYVTVKETGNGSTVYKFNTDGNLDELTLDNKFKIFSNIVSFAESGTLEDNWCNYWKGPLEIDGYNHFPFPPVEDYSYKRGAIDFIETRNNLGKLIHKINLNYENIANENEPIWGIKLAPFVYPYKSSTCSFFGGDCPLCSSGNPQFIFSKYNLRVNNKFNLKSKTETTYDPTDETKSSTITTNFTLYNDYGQLSSVSQTQSDDSKTKKDAHYVSDMNNLTLSGSFDDASTALVQLYSQNTLNSPVEILQKKDDKVIGGQLYIYNLNSFTKHTLPIQTYKIATNTPINNLIPADVVYDATAAKYKFTYDTRYYVPDMNFDAYDEKGNILQTHKENGRPNSYIWGYNGSYPIAQVQNASAREIFFTSFEEDKDFPGIDQKYVNDFHSGRQCAKLESRQSTGAVDIQNSDRTTGKYIYSAWVKTTGSGSISISRYATTAVTQTFTNTNDKWQYVKVVADVSQNISCAVSNTGTTPVYVDDVRLYPAEAQMVTYTYDPLIGMTSQTDAKDKTTYYKYDNFGRLARIKDDQNKVLKEYKYHYAGNSTDGLEPEANFTYSTADGIFQFGKAVTFLADIGGDVDSYDWDFGDGSTHVNGRKVSYTYQYGTLFNPSITLTVKSVNKVSESITKTITFPRIFLSQAPQDLITHASDLYVGSDQLVLWAETPPSASSTGNETYELYWASQQDFNPAKCFIDRTQQTVQIKGTDGNYLDLNSLTGSYSGPSYVLDLKNSNLADLVNTSAAYNKLELIFHNTSDREGLFTYAPVSFHPGDRPTGGGGSTNPCDTKITVTSHGVTGNPDNPTLIDGSLGNFELNWPISGLTGPHGEAVKYQFYLRQGSYLAYDFTYPGDLGNTDPYHNFTANYLKMGIPSNGVNADFSNVPAGSGYQIEVIAYYESNGASYVATLCDSYTFSVK